MQHRHGRGQFRKTGFEALDGLGRQGDFRYHDQGGFSGFHHLGDGLKVNLRFAGAGDSLQEHRFFVLRRAHGRDFFQRLLLLVVQLHGLAGDELLSGAGVAVHGFLLQGDEALGRQAAGDVQSPRAECGQRRFHLFRR